MFSFFQLTKSGIKDVINVLVAIVCSVLLRAMFGKEICSAKIVSLKSQGIILKIRKVLVNEWLALCTQYKARISKT